MPLIVTEGDWYVAPPGQDPTANAAEASIGVIVRFGEYARNHGGKYPSMLTLRRFCRTEFRRCVANKRSAGEVKLFLWVLAELSLKMNSNAWPYGGRILRRIRRFLMLNARQAIAGSIARHSQ